MVNIPNLAVTLTSDSMPILDSEPIPSRLAMPFEKECKLKCSYLPDHLVEVGKAFREVLHMSLADDRIVFGVSNCAELMDKSPEEVVMCIFSGSLNGEYANQIYYKLIETLCWHYDISLGMVSSVKAMKTLLPAATAELDNEELECILVAKPVAEELTPEEDVVVKFCRQHSAEDEPPLIPIIDT